MVQIARYIVKILLQEKIITEQDVEIYEYGCQITLSNIINFMIILGIGVISKSVVQTAIFYFSFISLRIYCGGYHANSYYKCFCIFGSICSLCVLLGHFLEKISLLAFISAGSIVLLGVCIYKMAPIEHGNRPLTEEERKKFRLKSWKMYILWGAICIIFQCLGYFSYQAILTLSLLSVTILMIKTKIGGESYEC